MGIKTEGAMISGSKAYGASHVVDTAEIETLSIFNKYTVAASTAKTFTTVDEDEDTATSTAHGFETGRKFALTTAGTLPAGLIAQDYYAIKVDANTLKFALSLADAIAGTAVDITDAGTGTHTMTPAALSACSIKLQESNNGVDYTDLGSFSSTITTTGASIWKISGDDIAARYIKILFAIGDGQVDITSTICGKGQ